MFVRIVQGKRSMETSMLFYIARPEVALQFEGPVSVEERHIRFIFFQLL